jgi:cell division septation protein DedD
MARALAGRGYDEAVVRSAIRSFAAEGRGPSGEAAVRAVFVEPMLQWAAEHLLDAPGTSRPAAGSGPFPASERRQPAPTPQRPQPAPAAPTRAAPTAAEPEADPAPASRPRREEPVRPEAAWAVLWADLADSGRRPDEAAGSGGDDGDDLMAVANAVQARRRVRLLRR